MLHGGGHQPGPGAAHAQTRAPDLLFTAGAGQRTRPYSGSALNSETSTRLPGLTQGNRTGQAISSTSSP